MNKTEFAQKQHFNGNWETYLITGGNTFEVKDVLKANGFKFTKELNWHSPEELPVPDGFTLVKVTFDECFDADLNLKSEIRDMLKSGSKKKADPALEPYTNSAFVGEEGERIRNIQVRLIAKKMVETPYGMNYCINLETAGNILTWYTTSTSIDDYEIGDTLNFSFTVKAHKTYYGIDQTIITRGYIKKVG